VKHSWARGIWTEVVERGVEKASLLLMVSPGITTSGRHSGGLKNIYKSGQRGEESPKPMDSHTIVQSQAYVESSANIRCIHAIKPNQNLKPTEKL
jgi:hypothetical protein